MKAGTAGARCEMPNDMGAAMRMGPRRLLDCSLISASTASPSARMRAARSSEAWPLAVSDMRREVRWNRLVLSRVSSRVMALEMVGWETPRSAAALAKEPVSATLAKTAQASRSGSLGMKVLE